jgi:hypothetical protein
VDPMPNRIAPIKRESILRDVADGLRYREIALRHQVSLNAVSKIALKEGIRKKDRPGLLDDAQSAEVVARYEAWERVREIAASSGISVDLVLKSVHRSGADLRSLSEAHARLPLRHDALDVLTPDAAYWCGFLFTDGTVFRRPGRSATIALVLKKSDRRHLEKFREFLGSGHAVTSVKPAVVALNGGQGTGAVRFAVNSERLGDRLKALGRYGPGVDPELARSRDFWRGAIDGDGTIGVSCDIPQCKLVGSHWLLSAYVDFLGDIGYRPLRVRPARCIYVVSTSGRTAEKVVERLYSGATTVLDRKAAKASEILQARQQLLAA